MATSALAGVLIFGLSFVFKCEFSAAHAPAQGPGSSPNSATLLYLFIEDLHELTNENKVLAEKIGILEGKQESLESLETSAEVKMIAQKVEMIEEVLGENLEHLNEQQNENTMMTDKIETLEGKLESLENSTEVKTITQKVERLEEDLNEQRNENEMMKKKMEMLEGKLEALELLEISTEVQLIMQKVERIEAKLEVLNEQPDEIKMMLEKIETLEERLETLESDADQYAFKVLRSENVISNGYDFLVLEVRVPADGLSKSSNWCFDYQYLCEDFHRRPTGCGSQQSSTPGYKDCRDKYNSDMNIGDTLGCNPSKKIAGLASIAFPNLSSPARDRNAFGFCNCQYCNKTIRGSAFALQTMLDFWYYNATTTFYTVCR